MNFFRLRVINTLLLFLIGIVLGFILKERFYPAPMAPAQAGYNAPYPVRSETPSAGQAEGEEPADEPTDEPYPVQDAEAVVSPPRAASDPAAEEPARAEPEALVIEATPAAGISRGPGRPAVKGSTDDFFRNPSAYEGRELEMDLQMITAKRAQRGWRVNLVYTGPDKKIDYLYADDPELLGDKPDLRIGYVYKVRFLCVKGDTSSGNTLLAISPTGEKAAWATGLSAVE